MEEIRWRVKGKRSGKSGVFLLFYGDGDRDEINDLFYDFVLRFIFVYWVILFGIIIFDFFWFGVT